MNNNPSPHQLTKKILLVLKKQESALSKRQIAKVVGVSPATASKYVDILHAKGLLEIEYHGNIQLVTPLNSLSS
ncbi:unnamed protein product, partial [marine sediment metagenome]